MNKRAVDVVLLPDETMTAKAVEANFELVTKFGNKIVLNREDCLPHISLAMGCIDEEDIISVEGILQSIAKKCFIGDLVVLGVQNSINSAREKVSVFKLKKTEELESFHKTIMEKMEPYLSYDVNTDMICGDEEVAETTLEWIKNYREQSSFDKFFPHITIGYGELGDFISFPIRFTASRLALCHLGNHCTCRKILASAGFESAIK